MTILRDPMQIVFHSSPVQIDTFYPFTHFGTKRAALERIEEVQSTNEQTFYLHEVELSIERPLRIYDDGTDRAMGGLLIDAVPSFEQAEALLDTDDPTRAFQDWLVGEGYDSLVYANQIEDVGSDSYVNVFASQARLIGIEPVHFKPSSHSS